MNSALKIRQAGPPRAQLLLMAAMLLGFGQAWGQQKSPMATPAAVNDANLPPTRRSPGEAVLWVNPTAPATATLRLPSRRGRTSRLRAGEGLMVEVPYVNPFMHEVLIQGVSATYELAASEVGDKSTPANNPKPEPVKFDRDANDHWEELSGLTTALNSYLNVLEQLRLAYEASTWSPPLVEGWLRTLRPAAVNVFETAEPGARQVAAWPANAQQRLARLRQRMAEEPTRLERTSTDLPPRGQRTAGQQAKADELSAKLARAKQLTAALEQFEQRLTQSLGAAVVASPDNEELLLLGRVYAKLRERARNPDQLASQRLTADGDELDVTVALKPLTSYRLPPASTAAQTFTYVRTLPVTHRFRVSVSAGVFVSRLVNHRFALFEDSTQVGRRAAPDREEGDTATVRNFRRMKRIERENTRDRLDVGITTLTHFHYRFWPAFDLAASVGVGVQTSGIRVLGGVSTLFGGKEQRLCLTAGYMIGPVTRLSGGYGEGRLVPVGVNTVPTQTVNRTSGFVAASWNLTGTRK